MICGLVTFFIILLSVIIIDNRIEAYEISVNPEFAANRLVESVESLYERASLGKTITCKQTWKIGKLYTDLAVEKLSNTERKDIDDKIYFIADTYLKQKYEFLAPTEPAQGNSDDNGWKIKIQSPYIPPAHTITGEPISTIPGEPFSAIPG